MADLERVGVAEPQLAEAVAVEARRRDLHDGDVGLVVAADDLARVGLAVGELEVDLVGVLDDVVVGDNVALVEVDEEAGAEALLARRGLLLRAAEARAAAAYQVNSSFAPAWEAMLNSRGLGRGLGLTEIHGIWARVLAEAGVVGLALYLGFFGSLIRALYRVRHSPRVVVSNVSALSVALFGGLLALYLDTPYSACVWVWYSIWALFASTPRKKAAS